PIYAMAVARRRLLHQPFSSLCNILVISLSLAVPIVVAAVLDTARPVVSQLPVSAEVTLYLERSAAAGTAQTLGTELQQRHPDEIESVEVITRDQALAQLRARPAWSDALDRKSTRLNSSHVKISYAVFCLKKKKNYTHNNHQ